MNSWWDDFSTLLFKRAMLLQDQAGEALDRAVNAAGRYVVFLWQRTMQLSKIIGALMVVFLLCIVINVRVEWIYESLLILMGCGLLAIFVLATPVLFPAEIIYNALPDVVKRSIFTWQRRGAAILFGVMVAIIFIKSLRLYQSPGLMLNFMLILATIWLGGYFGWLQISASWRKMLGAKLMWGLAFLTFIALFPGPSRLVEELVHWGEERLETGVFQVTRPTPLRLQPVSADDMQFVDAGTGRFLVWYSVDAQGNYDLYQSKGYGQNGRPLQAADTEEKMAAIRAWQREQDRARAMARQEEDKKRRLQTIAEVNQILDRARSSLERGELDQAEREVNEIRGFLSSKHGVLATTDSANVLHEQSSILATKISQAQETMRQAEKDRQRNELITGCEAAIKRALGFVEGRDLEKAEHEVVELRAAIVSKQHLLEENEMNQMSAQVVSISARIKQAREAMQQAKDEQTRAELLAGIDRQLQGVRRLLESQDIDAAEREVSELRSVLAAKRSVLPDKDYNDADGESIKLAVQIRQTREAMQQAKDQQKRTELATRFDKRIQHARILVESNDYVGAEREVREARAIVAPNPLIIGEAKLSEMMAKADETMKHIATSRAAHDDRLRLQSYIIAMPKIKVNYVVFSVDSNGKASNEHDSVVLSRLNRMKSITAASGVFADAFVGPRGFEAVASGKAAQDVAAMKLGSVADRLLLIRIKDAKSAESTTVLGLRTYTANVIVSIIDAADGKRIHELAISDIVGAGVDERAARNTFLQRFVDALADRSELALTGSP